MLINSITQPNYTNNLSFEAMKKSQFKRADRICVEKFKAPIEKFNSKEDLQN